MNIVDDMLKQVNYARSKNKLSPIKLDKCLNTQAQRHTEYMARNRSMTHSGFSSRIKACNRSSGSENVATGQRTVKACMLAWLKSDGHYKNIMGRWTVCGVGMSNNYWCIIFSS